MVEAQQSGVAADASPHRPLIVVGYSSKPEGRAALTAPLAHFASYEFVIQCTTPACRPRRISAASVLAKRPGLSVTEALEKLRCQPCGAPLKIAGMARANTSSGEHWLVLRGCGLRWRG